MTERPTLAAPHNLDAERGVLGAMLLDGSIIDDVLAEVRADDFYLPAHRHIFAAIRDLHAAGRPVELTLLTDSLRCSSHLDEAGGLIYLAALEQGVLTIGAAPELARTVAEKSVYRRLMTIADGIMREASAEARPADKALASADRLISDLADTALGYRKSLVRPLSAVAELLVTEMDLQRKGEAVSLPPAFPVTQDVIHSYRPGDMVIVAARPSLGKTMLALQLAEEFGAKGFDPLFFQYEMRDVDMLGRLIARESGLTTKQLRTGAISDEEFARFSAVARKVGSLPIHICDSPRVTLEQIPRIVERHLRKHPNTRAIFLDYLSLIPSDERRRARHEEVSHASKRLKAMAKDLGLVLFLLQQMNRANEDGTINRVEMGRPLMSNLKESGSIEEDADIVILLYRKYIASYYTECNIWKYFIDALVEKNRGGVPGRIRMGWDRSLVRFTDPEGAVEAPAPMKDGKPRRQEQKRGGNTA